MRKMRLGLLITLLWLAVVSTALASVSLENFEGSWNEEPNEVTLLFATGSEIDHAAFHVWRSTANVPPSAVNQQNATRITITPILGENACTSGAANYEFIDDTISVTEDRYFYYLESLSCTGGSEFYGALDVLESGLEVRNPNVPLDQRTYLTLLQRVPN